MGHSARAQAMLPLQLLLTFILVVACPIAGLVLYRYYRISTPQHIKKAQKIIALIIFVIFSLIIFIMGQLGGWPPLLFAARNGYRDIEKMLINISADVNVKDRYDGWTPLMHAVWKGDVEMVKLLLEKGADVNAKDKAGKTALWWAVTIDRKEARDILVKCGAKE